MNNETYIRLVVDVISSVLLFAVLHMYFGMGLFESVLIMILSNISVTLVDILDELISIRKMGGGE